MRSHQALQTTVSPVEQPQRRAHGCYTVDDLLALLALPRSTFFHLRNTGRLPFVEELLPRVGRQPRYRMDLVDRYLAGQWQQPRAFRACHKTQFALAETAERVQVSDRKVSNIEQ